MLHKSRLDQKDLYGADRLNCLSYDNWTKHKSKIVPQFQYRYLVNPVSEFPLASRLVHNEYGYCPIGYFQLWHSSAKRIYPVVNGSAEHSDVMFAVQWPIQNRVLLPGLFVYHLESEHGHMGKDWNGRRSRPFGPEHHHHHHHPKPYCHDGGKK